MPAAAQLIDATKKYGAVEALKGISLDIEPGEVVAMLRPNGAGKTTSISLMLGLRKPTSGNASSRPAPVTNQSVASNFALLGAYAVVFFALAGWAYRRDTSLKFT